MAATNRNTPFKTQYFPGSLDSDFCWSAYYHLRENIEWIDGIRSRKNGLTRKARPLMNGEEPIVDKLIQNAISQTNYQNYLPMASH